MVRERATRNGVGLDARARPELRLVEGDERRIRQVVFNLLSNGIKFTPTGGNVDVSASRRDGEVIGASVTPASGSPPPTRSESSRSSSRRTSVRSRRRARSRACLVQEADRAAPRADLGRLRAGQGLDVHLHAAREHVGPVSAPGISSATSSSGRGSSRSVTGRTCSQRRSAWMRCHVFWRSPSSRSRPTKRVSWRGSGAWSTRRSR